MRNPYEPPREESIPEDVEQPYPWSAIVILLAAGGNITWFTLYALARLVAGNVDGLDWQSWPSWRRYMLPPLLLFTAIGGGVLAGRLFTLAGGMIEFNCQRRRHDDSERDEASD